MHNDNTQNAKKSAHKLFQNRQSFLELFKLLGKLAFLPNK